MGFLFRLYALSIAINLLLIQINPASSSEINLISNNLYPTSYVEDGKIKGLAIEISKAVFKRAGLEYPSPQIYPYKRALYLTENSSNTVLVSLARTPTRAANFVWIGRLVVAVRFIVSRKDSLAYSIAEARELESIGVLKGSSLENQLKGMGFKNLVPLETEQTSFRMLSKQRLDAWYTSNVLLSGVLLSQGLESRSAITIGPPLSETTDVYMAASKNFPEGDFLKLKSAFQQLENEGALTSIRRKYGLESYQ
ncbi:transporter substrate-binding domain-containing protein [Sneathiella sp. P13V-1]|uniref:substrate-binding periplasmic protein n=1 Tax=Sneathiella sp. P13V-1 TaxID=2697366 RepID=UPI00187BC395|nr:transporter substrate-binding domain-containing protein [Sneathiella sp. P13V-1]MBE7638591.1 transporter substrate-binding domain-containing protein [Sneathiella sp. P13V-1]